MGSFVQPIYVCLLHVHVTMPSREILAEADQDFGRMLRQHVGCLLLAWSASLTLLTLKHFRKGSGHVMLSMYRA